MVEGIRLLREEYAGHLGVQLMLLPPSKGRAPEFARLLRSLRPDEVQLNAPLRAVPRAWTIEARGGQAASEGARLRTVSAEEAAEFEAELRRLTGLKIVSAYRPRA